MKKPVAKIHLTFLFAALLPGSVPSPSRGADSAGQPVTLPTADGLELAGRYWPGRAGTKSPAVIVLDDLGAAAAPGRCDAVAGALAESGCAALCFDFRGQGRSRAVGPDFWADPTNRRLVRGYDASRPRAAVATADFKTGYLPTLANDIAAARTFLDRRNDIGECNARQLILVGFGRGATLGALWAASEWHRYRSYGGLPTRLSTSPEGRDIAGCVWVGLAPKLDRRSVPVADWVKIAAAKRSTLTAWVHGADDSDAVRLAAKCTRELNRPGDTIFVDRTAARLGDRDRLVEEIGGLVKSVRDNQDLPVWDDRDYADCRFVWSLPGSGVRVAKLEGEVSLRPTPVEFFVRR